jgi:hypothetical protein
VLNLWVDVAVSTPPGPIVPPFISCTNIPRAFRPTGPLLLRLLNCSSGIAISLLDFIRLTHLLAPAECSLYVRGVFARVLSGV